MNDETSRLIRNAGWTLVIAVIEGTCYAAMIWLLRDAIVAASVITNSQVGRGPGILFLVAGVAAGWCNGRLVSNLFGVGRAVQFVLLMQVPAVLGSGWVLCLLIAPPVPADALDYLIVFGVTMWICGAFVLHEES